MPYKVMIVDDSRLARMSVAKVLGALHPDWTRVEASNADEALAIARDGDVDMTVMDYNMPGKDGLELAVELRALKPSMPVAIITANIQIEIVNKAKEVGAAFLPKPLTEVALKEFLEAAELRIKAAAR